MKITLFAHGLRGDVWPMISLGWHLAKREHQVTMAVPGEFQSLAERAGLRVVPLPFDMMAWLGAPEGQHLLSRGGAAVLRGLAAEYSRYGEALDDAHLAAAQGAEAMVGGMTTIDRAVALGDLQQVPVSMVFQQPAAPSGDFSAPTITRGRVRSRPLRRASNHLAYRLWWHGNVAATNRFRRRLGLPRQRKTTFSRMQEHGAISLHTFSPSLLPRPTDWADNLKVTAAWQMPSAVRGDLGEALPDELQSWLTAGDPPIFLGFGSMPVLDPEAMFDDVLAVTTSLGRRAIVSENCVPKRVSGALPSHLRTVGAVDHDRLFPQCAAIVHHGGLGSTTASARSGRPTMVCSVFSDQPWWGELLQRLGAGVHVPFRKLDRHALSQGLCTLLDPRVEARAADLGASIRSEGDGLPEATRSLEDWLLTAEPMPLAASRGVGKIRRPIA
ncbi:MAG: glycosyltransferase [Solirubrobacterales bacterium]